MEEIIAVIAVIVIPVVTVFSVPIVAIVLHHKRTQTKLKQEMIKDELELERLKNENYLLETEKMRLELQKMLEHKNDNNL